MYGVLTRTVMPPRLISYRMRQNWRRETGSTPVVGSSKNSTWGSWIRVQARASFCFIPPESACAGR
jgi:hypothetical protein